MGINMWYKVVSVEGLVPSESGSIELSEVLDELERKVEKEIHLMGYTCIGGISINTVNVGDGECMGYIVAQAMTKENQEGR